MYDEMYKECRDYAQNIADELRSLYNGEKVEDNESLADYICDRTLDIEYTLDSSKELIGVTLYITLGGPTAYIDTRWNKVVCSWGSCSASVDFDSDISEYINDYFNIE